MIPPPKEGGITDERETLRTWLCRLMLLEPPSRHGCLPKYDSSTYCAS